MLANLSNPAHGIFYEESLQNTIQWALENDLRFHEVHIRNMVDIYLAVYNRVEELYRSGTDPEVSIGTDADHVEIVDYARVLYDSMGSDSAIPISKTAFDTIIGLWLIEFVARRITFQHGKLDDPHYFAEIYRGVCDGEYSFLIEHHYLSGRTDYEFPQEKRI